MEEKTYSLEFHGGKAMGLLPLAILIIFAVYFFGFAGVYDTMALGLGGLVALIISSLFAKKITTFWDAVISGMSDELGNILALILLVVGIFGKMMVRGHIAEGFIWVGNCLHVNGSMICVFAFVTTAIIATATGTSIGTILTMVPILLPAGGLMGARLPVLIGAIMSGALFGDSIGPVSDVTIASSQTQEFMDGSRPDIGSVVGARLKYSLIAGALSIILFAVFGGGTGKNTGETEEFLRQYSDPKGLLMLIPMIVLLLIAFKTKSIFIAASIGSIVGTVVGIATGIMELSDILYVHDGEMSGFIIDGITSMVGIVIAIYMLVAIIGVLRHCGMMDLLISRLSSSKAGQSPMGVDLMIAFGTTITGFAIGAMNGPTCLMFGPVANELGKKAGIHPYRRANLLACFASTLPTMSPFSSVFIILTMGSVSTIVSEYSFIEPISPLIIPGGMFFCMMYPLVFLISIFTGWSREFEGEDTKKPNKIKIWRKK